MIKSINECQRDADISTPLKDPNWFDVIGEMDLPISGLARCVIAGIISIYRYTLKEAIPFVSFTHFPPQVSFMK